MKRFIQEYKVELISVGIILFGIFLVVERLEIRATIMSVLRKAINAVLWVLKQIIERIGNRAAVITASDALGILLILLAVGFIVWRIRHRFQVSTRWAVDHCPRCSNPIVRVHRTWWDRILGAIFLPEARRYRCVDSQCGWGGLLRRHVHHRRRSERASDLQN